MTQPRRVAITGVGLVGPWGSDRDEFFRRLMAGESGISQYDVGEEHLAISMPALHCKAFDADAEVGRAAAAMDRATQLGAAAANHAWREAGLPAWEAAQPRAGIYWGTALAGTLTFEQGYREIFLKGRRRVPPLSLLLGMNSATASHIAIQRKLGGPCLTYTVACASAANAIGEGYRCVRDGRAEVMLVGGSDSPMSLGVVRAWEALRVLAPVEPRGAAAACRPFSPDRAGLVLGEGAAARVLEDGEHARQRGATSLAERAGYGISCDASHLVRPAAQGQIAALRQALDDGGLEPAQIDYINAHGTATREGDPTEVEAIAAVFGARAERLAVSATKSMHAHMMGATGALEAVICVEAMRRGAIPPTAHLEEVDPACVGVRHVALRGIEQPVRACLSNSFAFGGSNAVLAFRAA
jgi:3-oxoacyl-[acyl-carrier-protein] synthase II